MILKDFTYELVNIFCLPTSTEFNAVVRFQDDIAEVLPYLNASLTKRNYSHEGKVLDFMHQGHIVTIEPRQMKVTGLSGPEEAEKEIRDLVDWINDIWAKRDGIEPLHENVRPATPLDVLKHLPKTNCGDCGEPTCLAFSLKVINGQVTVDACPELKKPAWAEQGEALRSLLSGRPAPRKVS